MPSFNNQSYAINAKAKKDIRNIFDYIFTGKGLEYKNIKKRSFFVEACEYKRHFLYLDLDYAIITSLELDHTDYYKDMKDYLSAFKQLASKVKQRIFIPKDSKILHSALCTLHSVQEVPIKAIKFTHLLGDHNNVNGSLVLELISAITKKPKAKILSTMKTFG